MRRCDRSRIEGCFFRRATYDAVVDHYEVVDAALDGAVGNVVDVSHEVVARAVFGDEGAELGVFDGDFVYARPLIENGFDFGVIGLAPRPLMRAILLAFKCSSKPWIRP